MKAKQLLFVYLKLLLIFSLVCFISCIPPNGKYKPQNISDKLCDTSTIGNKNLNAIIFVNPHVGIAVGDNGTVIRTTNGGYNWTAPISITPKNLYGIAAVDNYMWIAVGEAGTIQRSTDGGVTWVSVTVITQQTLRTVSFYEGKYGFGYTAGDSGLVFKTTDRGLNWNRVHQGASEVYNGLSYNKRNELFCVGNKGTVLKIDTSGSISVTNISAENLKSVHFALASYFLTHSDTGFIVGDGGTIFKTINGGDNWNIDATITTTSNLRCVFLSSPFSGHAVGENGTILRYNGKKWTVIPPVTTKNFNGVDFIWSDGDFCVGDDGIFMSVCPLPVPTSVGSITPILMEDCNNWSFKLDIQSLSFRNPDNPDELLYINRLTASASVQVLPPPVWPPPPPGMPRSGWAVHDNFHNETDPLQQTGPYSFTDFLLDRSVSGPYYVTCCLVDQYERKWLLGKYVCPAQPQ